MPAPTATVEEPAAAEFRRALLADPAANTARLAKRVGLSGRAARRLVLDMEREGLVQRRRRSRVALTLVAGSLLAGSLWTWHSHERQVQARAPRDPSVVSLERDLYRALEAHDRARMGEAVAQLHAGDEALRLAALRYLVSEKAEDRAAEMVELLDDPSERVRPAAIQLLGKVAGSIVDDRLLAVVLGPDRPLAERLLACTSLEQRTVADGRAVARRALPALRDPAAPVRDAVGRLLTRLTGRRVALDAGDPDALHAAWSRAIGD